MKATVIGAGATGLALAYLLSQNDVDVTVIEAAPEAGGLLTTFDPGGGGRLERFYHHFFTHDAEIHWLLEELGLRSEVQYLATTMGLYRRGTIYPFNGPRDLLGFDCISLVDRLRFGFSSALLAYLPGYCDREDEAAIDWFRKTAGAAATAAIWEPLFNIKFGDVADRIPLAWMAGRLRQRARSRSGAQEQLGYLKGSLQVLVDRLVEVLTERGVEFHLNTKADSLVLDHGAVTGVRTADGTIPADVVVSTVPTPILAPLVREIDPAYAEALSQIQYLGAMCTILAVDRKISPVYWLNITDGGHDFGGVIEQTNFIPASEYGNRHIVYLSRYLSPEHPLWSMSDEELLARQTAQLGEVFQTNIHDHLLDSWVFRGRYAAPICDLGFARRIPKSKSPIPNLYLASMCHVYPDERGVNNSIRIAAETVKAMGLDAAMVPTGSSIAGKYCS